MSLLKDLTIFICLFILLYFLFGVSYGAEGGLEPFPVKWAWFGADCNNELDCSKEEKTLPVGWVSFNSNNPEISCQGYSYGVKINYKTGQILGIAFIGVGENADVTDCNTSENTVGFINFNSNDLPPCGNYGFPNDYCFPAKAVETQDGWEIQGWAPIISKDDLGHRTTTSWVRFKGSNYVVKIKKNKTISSEPGEHYAWTGSNGEGGFGWLDFAISAPPSSPPPPSPPSPPPLPPPPPQATSDISVSLEIKSFICENKNTNTNYWSEYQRKHQSYPFPPETSAFSDYSAVAKCPESQVNRPVSFSAKFECLKDKCPAARLSLYVAPENITITERSSGDVLEIVTTTTFTDSRSKQLTAEKIFENAYTYSVEACLYDDKDNKPLIIQGQSSNCLKETFNVYNYYCRLGFCVQSQRNPENPPLNERILKILNKTDAPCVFWRRQSCRARFGF